VQIYGGKEMNTVDRNTYDSYEMLIELVKPLVNYFKETKNEDLFIDTYKFCNYIINDENYEFGSVVYDNKPWKHTISYNGNYLNEQEIYELLVKFDFVKNQPTLSTKQIDIINHVLKHYYSKSDLFLNEEGKINPQKEVEIPNTGITTSVEEIREIRALLKQLRKNTFIEREKLKENKLSTEKTDKVLTYEFLLKNGFEKSLEWFYWKENGASVSVEFDNCFKHLGKFQCSVRCENNGFHGYIQTIQELQDIMHACGVKKELIL
jgi:hypothetical protein